MPTLRDNIPPKNATYSHDPAAGRHALALQNVSMLKSRARLPAAVEFSDCEAANEGPRGRLEGDGAMRSCKPSKVSRRRALEEQRLGDAGTPQRSIRYNRVLECGREVPIAPDLFVSAAVVGHKVRLLVRIANLKTNSAEQPAFAACNGPT